jgi:osmotically-inducible protein OsmY
MKNFKIIFLLLLCFSLTSCIPTLFTAAASTTIASAKDRSFGNTIDDITISGKIKKEFIAKGFKKLYTKIDSEVVQGRVLLTGFVETEEDVIKAVEICWSIDGVVEVINELKITESSNKFDTARFAKDSWITSRITSAIFFDRSIKFANYTIVTQDAIVYIFGIARTEEELQKVTKIASEISGVRKVVSHVHMRQKLPKKRQSSDEILDHSKSDFENPSVDELNDIDSFDY